MQKKKICIPGDLISPDSIALLVRLCVCMCVHVHSESSQVFHIKCCIKCPNVTVAWNSPKWECHWFCCFFFFGAVTNHNVRTLLPKPGCDSLETGFMTWEFSKIKRIGIIWIAKRDENRKSTLKISYLFYLRCKYFQLEKFAPNRTIVLWPKPQQVDYLWQARSHNSVVDRSLLNTLLPLLASCPLTFQCPTWFVAIYCAPPDWVCRQHCTNWKRRIRANNLVTG